MSKISIIIPTYNVEAYLDKCLQSVINQTLKDIEIICINDGSTDDSLNILKKYEALDKRIILITQENKGVSVARNLGLKKATSSYVMFVDPDDWLELNACEIFYNAITTNDCDLVQAKINLHYNDLSCWKEGDEQYFNNRLLGIYTITPNNLNTYDHSAGGKLWKKEIIDKYRIDFPEGLYYEDAPFAWKYFSVSQNILIIKNKLYNYLRRQNSTMSRTFNKGSTISLDHIKICFDFYNYLYNWNLFNKYEETFWIIFETYFWVTLAFLPNNKQLLAFSLAHSFLKDKKVEHLKDRIDHSVYKTLINLKNKKYNKIYSLPPKNIFKKLSKLIFYKKYDRNYKTIIIFGLPIYLKQQHNPKSSSTKFLCLERYKDKDKNYNYEIIKIFRLPIYTKDPNMTRFFFLEKYKDQYYTYFTLRFPIFKIKKK